MTKIIDINCDMGESYGAFIVGNDAAIFPYITSCSIACGFHGGDAIHMQRTVRKAVSMNIRIGAHPSYPDRWGFGRRTMSFTPDELKAIIRYQVGALMGVARAEGVVVEYVKPHGALYNTAATDIGVAMIVAETIRSLGDLAFMGLSGSKMAEAASTAGIPFIPEAFADRRYTTAGTLVPRSETGAVINAPQDAAAQAELIAMEQRVITVSGESLDVEAQSICVHGDHPSTVEALEEIDRRFAKRGIRKTAIRP
jgi:UPF0271 protein